VWCDDLRGCASQGETREEAIENIRIAIREYLESLEEDLGGENDGLVAQHEEIFV
jgi:predicted RNase H-like HicB family nuclease